MKRSPIRRRTPLRSKGGQMKRGGVRPVSARKKPGVSDSVAQAVIRRSGGWCERCKKVPATDLHHRVTRARGGPHDDFNLCHLCSRCHHEKAHGENEYPWLVRGRFIRGKYLGPDALYLARYPVETR